MCHSCESRNPGVCVIPAKAGIQAYVSFLRKQESRPFCACYGVPAGQAGTLKYFLDSRFRGNDTLTRPISVGWPASPTRGEASCLVRLKCYKIPTPPEHRGGEYRSDSYLSLSGPNKALPGDIDILREGGCPVRRSLSPGGRGGLHSGPSVKAGAATAGKRPPNPVGGLSSAGQNLINIPQIAWGFNAGRFTVLLFFAILCIHCIFLKFTNLAIFSI